MTVASSPRGKVHRRTPERPRFLSGKPRGRAGVRHRRTSCIKMGRLDSLRVGGVGFGHTVFGYVLIASTACAKCLFQLRMARSRDVPSTFAEIRFRKMSHLVRPATASTAAQAITRHPVNERTHQSLRGSQKNQYKTNPTLLHYTPDLWRSWDFACSCETSCTGTSLPETNPTVFAQGPS